MANAILNFHFDYLNPSLIISATNATGLTQTRETLENMQKFIINLTMIQLNSNQYGTNLFMEAGHWSKFILVKK